MSNPPQSLLLRLRLVRDFFLGLYNLFLGRTRSTLLRRLPQDDLTGRIAIITGGNSGIGCSIAKQLAQRGCTIYIAVRSVEKGMEAARDIEQHARNHLIHMKDDGETSKIRVLELDASSFASVQSFVKELANLDIKIDYMYNNAGISGFVGLWSEDEHDLTYQTNFLAQFLLTQQLLENNLLAEAARIIFTSSNGHYTAKFNSDCSLKSTPKTAESGFHYPTGVKTVTGIDLYANSKCMQIIYARILQNQFDKEGSRMQASSFSPMFTATSLSRKAGAPKFIDDPILWILVNGTVLAVPSEEGAATGVWLALADIQNEQKGVFWERCTRRISLADLMSEDLMSKLWARWNRDAYEWAKV